MLPEFGGKLLSGIVVGYAQQAGGSWSGDIEVIDAIDLTNASSTNEIHAWRISAQEITVNKPKDGNFVFPIIEEDWDQPSNDAILTRRIKQVTKLVTLRSDNTDPDNAQEGEEDEDDHHV